MVKLIIRTVVSVLALILIFLVSWNYLGDAVLTPLFIPLCLLIILILLLIVEKIWFKSDLKTLTKEYLFVILVFVVLYLMMIISNIVMLSGNG